MKKYIGVKIVQAEPMSEQKYRGNELDHFNDYPGYKVTYPDGYVSWCPKKQFEEANREISDMTFGMAIEALKKGFRVSRSGWNGKGMWLKAMQSTYGVIDLGEHGIIKAMPWIGMRTATEEFVPWLASQTDILSEDWGIVE